MSSSLPVPSKGALRALRHIALGTTCTVAFGAGLITEDRRRRIHTAREASENARRLKTSRKYHSAGLSVATTFEEQVENYCKYGPWKGGTKQNLLDSDWNDATSIGASATKTSEAEAKSSLDTSRSAPTTLRAFGKTSAVDLTDRQPLNLVGRPKNSEVTDSNLSNPFEPPKPGHAENVIFWKSARIQNVSEAENSVCSKPVASPNTSKSRPAESFQKLDDKIRTQSQLAMQIFTILRDSGSGGLSKVEEAVSAFHRTFKGNISAQFVNQDLLDACILLAQECHNHGKVDMFIPVLSKILSCGYPIDEESLYKLQFGKAIARLLEQSGYRHADHQVVANIDKLKHAVAIFIARTYEKPKPLAMELRDVGLQLCTATLRANLFELTEAVFWRLLCARTDVTASEVECLILAEHRRAFWDQVLHHFSKYFSRTVPDQNQLNAVASAAIDSALELGRFDTAESILSTASQMAKNENLRTSTKWYLRVLGEHWRTTRDIATTQAFFNRLEGFIEQTTRPQAVYSAMIQFCVEADNESEVQHYLERLTKLGNGKNMDVRTHGHLALAKAKKNDWAGVEEDFRLMKKFAKGSIREHSNVFVPILKMFVASHDVGEVEDFVRLYVEDLDVVPNQYVFNLVVDTYCRAGELSNIPRWIGYVQQFGLQVDAVTFNTILSRCQKQWAAHPDDLLRIFRETNRKASSFFDSTTIRILDRAATSSTNPYRAGRLLRQVKLPTEVKCEKIEAEMRRALDRGDDHKVLNSYRFAMRSGKRITPKGFSIAVRASIRSAADGNLTSAIKLITDARSRGFNILPSMAHLLLHQVKISKCDGDDLVSLVKLTLAEFDKRGLEVTLSIASKVVGELIDRGRPEEALMLWNTLASHDHIARQPVDLILLTVLLRAHIMLSDIAGIKWVMAMLVENNITPDKQFKLVVKTARQKARRFLDARPDSFNAKQRYKVLDDSMQLIVSQRLNGEIKRKEAEQLTLSIVETALAAQPNNIQKEAKVGLSEVLPVKRSQRLRNPSKIWERLGKYGKFKGDLGMTNTVDGRQNDRKHHPEIAASTRREEETGTLEGQELTGIKVHPEIRAGNAGPKRTSSSETKQALSGWSELSIEPLGGYRKSPTQVVEAASG